MNLWLFSSCLVFFVCKPCVCVNFHPFPELWRLTVFPDYPGRVLTHLPFISVSFLSKGSAEAGPGSWTGPGTQASELTAMVCSGGLRGLSSQEFTTVLGYGENYFLGLIGSTRHQLKTPWWAWRMGYSGTLTFFIAGNAYAFIQQTHWVPQAPR